MVDGIRLNSNFQLSKRDDTILNTIISIGFLFGLAYISNVMM
jgi:hypothetical protein